MPYKNLAVEALRKLLHDEIKIRERKFLVQTRLFSKMLEESIQRYHNRGLEAAQVIEELIALAKNIRDARKRGEKLDLTEDELSFYDALEVNDSAVKVLGDKVLGAIARDLVKTIRENLSVDWSMKETVRAKLRVAVKRLLKQHGYPPDKQERATLTVLEQAELLCRNWPEDDLKGSTDKPRPEPISLEIVSVEKAKPFVTHVPVYSLQAAASKFSGSQDASETGWVEVRGHKLNPHMFVARVSGKSMEPRIPDGSWCLFRAHPEGSRRGKIVLAQHHGPADPETGGQYTVKLYDSEKHYADDTWGHKTITLRPINKDFQSLVLTPDGDDDPVQVIAEFLEVITAAKP